MTIKRSADAIWHGNLMDGTGTLSAPGGVLKNTPYSFKTRFADAPGTNPEELIAAAHAGCFTMALSAVLMKAGFTADSLTTHADLSLEKQGEGFTITAVHLTLRGSVPGIDEAKFAELAADAKANCPVSKVLNAKITLDAALTA
jgi:osmotically inducible protein OsmC